MSYIYSIKFKQILNIMEANTQIKVRLYSYTSFRHYGGREINTTPYVCSAIFIEKLTINNTNIVALTEDCAGYKKGHKIAVMEKDFNVQ